MIENENEIIKVVIHGRGGQGAVTASELIVEAAYLSGNFADIAAYPSFGAERRGAPVQSYAKLSRTEKIWDRAQITNPNILIVFDETVLNQAIADSVVKNGIVIINSDKDPTYFVEKYNFKNVKLVVADINKYSLEKGLTIDGAPVVNTPILGLLSKALPELNLENLKKVVLERMGEKIGILNNELIEQGYNLAKIL
ncbi:MAG: 2-oxoacid:acceptor oxidoreductase family protein [Promethearchaeota archaeon]